MNPDDIAIRPVTYGNAVRPVHREAASRDSTHGQRPSTQPSPELADATELAEQETELCHEETHLVDLRA